MEQQNDNLGEFGGRIFVTVDLARREDGTLVIMEFGDGQVSGLQEIQEKEFYSRFIDNHV